MSNRTLTIYKTKRNFTTSTEPTGGKSKSDSLCYVIQKHQATRLHYDFRLEMAGVLKSWAVPKGPSTDPEVKRLAVMVEDHPYDYRNFEGNIPSGYGAGTVMVWDQGIYELAHTDGTDKKKQEKELQKGILAGKLHIVIHGKKLKGEYALVKTKGKAENAWLLFKVKDQYVSKKDITIQDKSVLSGKTLPQIKKSIEATSNTNRSNGKADTLKMVRATNSTIDTSKINPKGKTAKFPTTFSPMLATMVNTPFDKPGWQYEIKWDGYRALAFCNKKDVELKSRNDNSFNKLFYPIHQALQQWNNQALLDGEVVVLDDNGKSDFGALQNWRSEADGELYYYVFDLLWMNGKDLREMPLASRRELLREILPANAVIRLSELFDVNGPVFFETVKRLGLEGIIAKKMDSMYSDGTRSKEWLKIKANKSQEMVIGGYTKNDDSPKSFSALLLGVYDDGKLIYTGKAGTGFTDKQQTDMLKHFKPYITKAAPFTDLPDINKPSRFNKNAQHAKVVWMLPELVCEVRFTEITKDGIMRHPSFVAMRTDKHAKDVKHEMAIDSKNITAKQKGRSGSAGKLKDTSSLFTPTEATHVQKINGHEIKFTNLTKIYWPKERITKGDMLKYYDQVAPYIIPYLKDRPQSMNRHPNGITGKSFYFKDVTGTAPDWIETFKYISESDNRVRNYLVAKNKASLLYMANLGCIEINPWHSRVESEDFPDWCIIDLDPAENGFQKVIEAATITHAILESMGVASYPKTSGSTGIHIYIPLGANYTYEQSREFARVIATLVQREIPTYTSIERSVKARKGKMYIDFLQNRSQATVSAPYSLRPKPGATVSMPLRWDEVKKGLKMSDFTIYNVLERIQSEGDLFKPVLGKGINIEKVIKTYSKE